MFLVDLDFDRKAMEDAYHELLLHNALHDDPRATDHFVEEFLHNALCLLDLGLEEDARVQFETAQWLARSHHLVDSDWKPCLTIRRNKIRQNNKVKKCSNTVKGNNNHVPHQDTIGDP